MLKQSAGLVLYNLDHEKKLMVFLVHPGGPFWRNKDEGTWSIPKGEYEEGEDALVAAKREFKEETGNELPAHGFVPLQPVKIKSGKVITAWAVKADLKQFFIKSNLFEMEWPPKSGRKQFFPEVDKADWFFMEKARTKITAGQVAFLDQLEKLLQDSNL